MKLFSFIKAPLVFALIAFLVYTFPVLGQIVIIGCLGLLWCACALQTLRNLRRKWAV